MLHQKFLFHQTPATNQNYKDFRDSKKAGAIMASSLREAYSELFERSIDPALS
jgi:hypothetical protein